jgi:hypothetical protein
MNQNRMLLIVFALCLAWIVLGYSLYPGSEANSMNELRRGVQQLNGSRTQTAVPEGQRPPSQAQ